MAFNTLYGSGVNFSAIFTPPSAGEYNYPSEPDFAPGQIMFGSDGSAFIYVEFGTGGATGLGYTLNISPAFEAVMSTSSNDAFGAPVGVAQATAAAGDFGWLQVFGPCQVFGVVSALANNPVAATTGGIVDDAGAAGTLYIDGMIFTTAVGSGGNALAAAFLSWPKYSTVPSLT
ncbi:hypothetical protein [Rhizobium sp. BK251]|uniref:hypothetical protein n=1 Tax=Rhizobium sp. BK251 TaxID=2512125 RepID=UPI00104A387D|nr:hypothetical protein [Rhizobium sp. BK251]TCL70540.1 hypothetical protein EV286_107415 [Rhizobium sp. BK251]